jgi:hypothetical protein
MTQHLDTALAELLAAKSELANRLGQVEEAIRALSLLPLADIPVRGSGWPPADIGGLTHPELILAFLRWAKRPQTTKQIYAALQQAGWQTEAQNPMGLVGITLRTMTHAGKVKQLAVVNAKGQILGARATKRGGQRLAVWGLPAWKKAITVKRAG